MVIHPDWAELSPYLKKYGRGPLSYSVLQPNMEYYIEEGVGFIAYYSYRHFLLAPLGRKIVLADPLCSEEHKEGMLERFITKHKHVILLQCNHKTGEVMDKLGYEVNMFGKECELPMPYILAGKNRAKIRQWRNKCEREGVVVEERAISGCDQSEIEALSKEWVQDKGGKELILLTRPFMMSDEPEVRCFWARKEGKLIGLAIFDPMYNNGNTVGYYHNFDRISKDAPHGTSAYIILEAMKVFTEENMKVVSLGLMPLHVLRARFRQNDFTMNGFRYAAKKLNYLYPFQGNISHKKKFAGRQPPVYFSSTNGNQLREMFILMKAMKMI